MCTGWGSSSVCLHTTFLIQSVPSSSVFFVSPLNHSLTGLLTGPTYSIHSITHTLSLSLSLSSLSLSPNNQFVPPLPPLPRALSVSPLLQTSLRRTHLASNTSIRSMKPRACTTRDLSASSDRSGTHLGGRGTALTFAREVGCVWSSHAKISSARASTSIVIATDVWEERGEGVKGGGRGGGQWGKKRTGHGGVSSVYWCAPRWTCREKRGVYMPSPCTRAPGRHVQ